MISGRDGVSNIQDASNLATRPPLDAAPIEPERNEIAFAQDTIRNSARRPLRVLLLCDRYPFPLQNGQNLRIFHYVTRLSRLHRFDLLCHGVGAPPNELKNLFEVIEHFPPPAIIRRRGFDRLRQAFSVDQMFPDDPHIRAHLARVLFERNYDVIWMSGWGMAMNLPESAFPSLLADAVDDGVLEFWRELKQARTLSRFLRMSKWLIMNYRFERRYFGPAARCLFVSDIDARAFGRVCPRTPVSVVNNGVDEATFRPAGLPLEPATIVFEGRMDFGPNVDGAVAFCRDVLPHIRAAIPHVRVKLVGMCPAAQVLELASANVEVTGFVEDVRPYLERASVFICPLRKGAGIKNKILQAWSMGKAVIATPQSVGGLNVHEGENILVRELDETFADAVVALLTNRIRAAAIGAAARQTVLEHYTWDRKASEMARLLEDVSIRAGACNA